MEPATDAPATNEEAAVSTSGGIGCVVVLALLLVGIIIAVIAGGNDGDGGSSGLSTEQACSEFYDIVGDLSLTDEESAEQFSDLASRTDDEELADAIDGVAEGFRTSEPAISSEDVQALC